MQESFEHKKFVHKNHAIVKKILWLNKTMKLSKHAKYFFSITPCWNIEILIVEHQVSSASLPQLYNNGLSAQEGQ